MAAEYDGIYPGEGFDEDEATNAALCANYTVFCPDFFTMSNSAYLVYIIVRLILFSFILFLSSIIPRDFLKTFTLYLFIPLFCGELCRVAVEFLYYFKHFDMPEEAAGKMLLAEAVLDKIHVVFATFVYYAFLGASIIVYWGLFKAFLNPESFERCKIGIMFNVVACVPVVIVILMFLPWGGVFVDIRTYVKYVSPIVLGIIMIPCYLRTVFHLSWQKTMLDSKIDDRLIIRRAKSRLIWFTIYMTIQNLINIPEFIEAIMYLCVYTSKDLKDDVGFLNIFSQVTLWASISDEARPISLFFCTLFLVPVYRSAILFCRSKPELNFSPVVDLTEYRR
uniref:G protein-coupled receptor n=1 Tax=Panagrellus redivivus TaxID=6233 RepID=A0A7E4W1V7_PANRE